MAERTKCYQPNEFDYICMLDAMERNMDPYKDIDERYSVFEQHSGTYDVVKIATAFYTMLNGILNEISETGAKFGRLFLHKQTLLFADKISRLQLLWKSDHFCNMVVYVDMAIGLPLKHEYNKPLPLGVSCDRFYRIIKAPRHDIDVIRTDALCPVSFSFQESKIFQAAPSTVRRGFVLAKAVRIADIARPEEHLTSHYGLQEDIHVDDLLTSYILMASLMKLLPRDGRAVEHDSACGWAIRIYERLKADLEAKKISSWYDEFPRLIDCTECKVECGCCKRRKLMLAMTSQVILWLKKHQRQLNDVNVADSGKEIKWASFLLFFIYFCLPLHSETV